MNYVSLVGLGLVLTCSPLMAQDKDQILFNFDDPEAAKPWQTVNDGVMGGRSDGRFKINEDRSMEFFGTLSLENNGGFASVRARVVNLGLENGDLIILRVRGDGREYSFNLYSQRTRNSYRQSFKSKKNEWIEIELPVDKFVATWRGRVFPNEKLDASEVNGLGILLGDKKAGRFKLEVDWIKVTKALGEGFKVRCEGMYRHHLQGVCTDEKAIYWSFTTTLVKTDMQGIVLKKIPVANHHGDLCFHDGKLFVAVNLGKFNDPKGNAKRTKAALEACRPHFQMNRPGSSSEAMPETDLRHLLGIVREITVALFVGVLSELATLPTH